MKNTLVTIAELELDKEHFPILYKWAKTHPDTLEKQLRGLAKATGNGNLKSVAIILEYDLEHERLR